MPFAIGGLVVLRPPGVPILPLLAVAAIATFAAALTFGVTRYRAPAEVAIVAGRGASGSSPRGAALHDASAPSPSAAA